MTQGIPSSANLATVSASAQMMQDYKSGSPVGLLTRFVTRTAADSTFNIYGMSSTGGLVRVYRDAATDTGWQTQTIPLDGPLQDLTLMSDRLWLIITGADGFLSLLKFDLDNDGSVGQGYGVDRSSQPDYVIGLGNPGGGIWLPVLGAFTNETPSSPWSFQRAVNDQGGWGTPSTDGGMVPNGDAVDGIHNTAIVLPLTNPAAFSYIQRWQNRLICYANDPVQTGAVPWTETPADLGLAGIQDFDVVITGNGQAVVVSVDGSNNVTLTGGSFDVTGIQPSTWSPPVVTAVQGQPSTPQFSHIRACARAGGIDLVLYDATTGRIWTSGADLIGAVPTWQIFEEFVEVASPAIALTTIDGQTALLAQLGTVATPQLTIWSRSEDGDYVIETVEVPEDPENPPPIQSTTVYKAVLNLVDDTGDTMAGQSLTLTASTTVYLSANGSYHMVGPSLPLVVETDGTGTVQVSMEIVNTAAAPVLSFASPLFEGGEVEVRCDEVVHAMLLKVSGTELLAGKTSDGAPLLPDGTTPEGADKLAGLVNQVAGVATSLYAQAHEIEPAAVRLVTRTPGVRWRRAGDLRQAVRIPADGTSSVRVRVVDGKLEVSKLTREEGEAYVHQLRRTMPLSFWDDIGDFFDSVVDAVSDVVEVVLTPIGNAVNAVITVVVDGISLVVNTIVDTVAKVFDVITCLFDQFGTLFGTFVKWLLKLLGFLFDWDKILALRDMFKDQVSSALTNIGSSVPDPNLATAQFTQMLETARTQINTLLSGYKSSTAGTQNYKTFIGATPSIVELFTFGGNNVVFEQAMWLWDKLNSVLPSSGLSFNLPDLPGLSDAFSQLQAAILAFNSGLAQLAVRCWDGAVSTWASSASALEGSNLDQWLTIVADAINFIIDTAEAVVAALAQLLHVFWNAPDKMLAWLSQKIYLPFFSSFYAGLMDADLSPLDLMCLGAAIPMSLHGDAPSRLAQVDDKKKRAFAISGVLCFGALAHGAATFMSAFNRSKRGGMFFAILDCLTVMAAGALMVVDDNWRQPGMVELVVGLFGFITVFRDATWQAVACLASLLISVISMCLRSTLGLASTAAAWAYLIIATTQVALTGLWQIVYGEATPPSPGQPPPPPPRVPPVPLSEGYVAVQTLLSAGLAASYMADAL